MPAPEAIPPSHPGVLPWLVGAFALWQLAFIPLANVFEFVPQRPSEYDVNPPIDSSQRWGRCTELEPLQNAVEFTGYLLASWAEITGQDQGWIMFTPAFPPYTVTLVLELHFHDGTRDRLYSRFEPDPSSPRSRFPIIRDREFNHEANIFMLAWHCHPKSLAEHPVEWSQLPERVRENEHLITRWLMWRTKQHHSLQPDKPEPTEVILILRYLSTPMPGGDQPQRPTFERPFARWFPTGPRQPGLLAIEGFDPVLNQWVQLKPWGRR